MIEQNQRGVTRFQDDGEISLFKLGSVVLRYRRMIVGFAMAGVFLAVIMALRTPRVYRSSATFLAKSTQENLSGIGLAAKQFGINLPTTESGWGPALYVKLLRSRTLLEPIALDTLVVSEDDGRRVAVFDLLDVPKAPLPRRLDLAVDALRGRVSTSEVRNLAGVDLAVTSKWPSVSLAIADRLVQGVSEFNLKTRKSQASEERQFVERQAQDAERALRAAEDRLKEFLVGNRSISNSPELNFQRERLQREVDLRQEVYASLVQSREEAKIREVRDTPVLTVIESPRLPTLPEPRNRVVKVLMGGLVGAVLGLFLAFLHQAFAVARSDRKDDAHEFFALVDDATPSFLKAAGR